MTSTLILWAVYLLGQWVWVLARLHGPGLSINDVVREDLMWTSTLGLVGHWLTILFLVPVVEELVFRGYLYRALRLRMGPLAANLLSSSIFAAMHAYTWQGVLSVFWFGVVAAWGVERTRSLVPGVLLHAGVLAFITLQDQVTYRSFTAW